MLGGGKVGMMRRRGHVHTCRSVKFEINFERWFGRQGDDVRLSRCGKMGEAAWL